MSGPDAGPGEASRAVLEIAPGAWLSVPVPDGAREEAVDALPAVTLPPIAGAELAARRGWSADSSGLLLRGACARAPSDRWAPGVEDLVLGRATELARGALGADVERWMAADIVAKGDRFEQRLEGSGRAGDSAVTATGRHVLGFVGAERTVFVCTLVCRERGDGTACARLVDGAEALGAFTTAPPPSLPARAIVAAAEHPTAALAVGAAITLAAVTVVLARRPRPARR